VAGEIVSFVEDSRGCGSRSNFHTVARATKLNAETVDTTKTADRPQNEVGVLR